MATTDPLKIIATAIGMIETHKLFDWFKQYFATEQVERILIGYPLNNDGTATHATPLVEAFIKKFTKTYPQIPIEKIDERYSSKFASQAIAGMGLKKKVKEKKGIIDEVSAVMLLQEWMNGQM
jgi:putative Holliday junction resolvase